MSHDQEEGSSEEAMRAALLEIATGKNISDEEVSVLLMQGIREGDIAITGISPDGDIVYELTGQGKKKAEEYVQEAMGNIFFSRGEPN